MQVRQQLRAGQALKTADLAKPDLVQRDQSVTLIYEATGLYLTIRGKALEGGTEGDVVNVLNLQSKRTMSGVVDRPRPGLDLGRRAPPARQPPTPTSSTRLEPSAAPVAVAANASFTRRLQKPSNSSCSLPVSIASILTGALLTTVALASGCSSIDRLSQIGETAEAVGDRESDDAARLQAGADADAEAGRRPPTTPIRCGATAPAPSSRTSARARIGDLLTVTVNITDKANIANETQRSRTTKEDSGITDFIGAKLLTGNAAKVLPGKLLTTDSTSSNDGKGSVQRQENLQTNVAAVVTQVLPNGNLVVEGKQEIRVNFEIRELIVAGIVRPEDIQSDNTIDSSKIAQARIAYGGRGQITDVQQPRYGQQVMDVLLPF